MYLTNKPGLNYQLIDVEANGLNPDTTWCLVARDLQTQEDTKCVGHDEIRAWCRAHRGDVMVGHNALSYDVPVLNRILGVDLPTELVVDTLILSYLYNPQLDGHSLEDYGQRFGIPKVGADIEDWSVYQPIMLDRCVRDVEINAHLFRELRNKMNIIGFSELSCELEHRTREAVNWQQDTGFYFNIEEAHKFLDELTDMCEVRAVEVLKVFPPELKVVETYKYKLKKDGTEGQVLQQHRLKFPKIVIDEALGTYDAYQWIEFNLGSPVQRIARLQAIGYVAVNFTKKTKKGGGGNPKVDEDGIMAFLEDCAPEHKPAVEAMAEWLVVNARRTMVTGWIKAYNPDTHAIHGRVWTCGAASRRATHNDPNTANIPGNEAKYGERCRSVWCARPNRVMVGCDAKSVQMRQFAHYLGNLEVGMEYAEGDPHQRNADAAGIPRKKVKNCFYAMIFGAQDARLGTTGHGGIGTPDMGKAIREALYASTPGLEALFKKAQAHYKANNGWVQCIDGGWVRCHSPHAALNYWIQSGEAVLMKMTLVKVWRAIKARGLDALQVGFIHDEIQYDCHPDCAEEVARLFNQAISESGKFLKFIIPMEGDSKVGPTWAQTH